MPISRASARLERRLSICDFDCSRLFFSSRASFCILLFSARRNLTITPMKKASAIEASTSAVRRLLRRVCSSRAWVPIQVPSPSPRYLITGGVSKVWNGAGDGSVHSRP